MALPALPTSRLQRRRCCGRISGADPFVIAMAKDGGANGKVVADEHPGSAENRKIPFVCNAEGVGCVTFQQMIFAEGQFQAAVDSGMTAHRSQPAVSAPSLDEVERIST